MDTDAAARVDHGCSRPFNGAMTFQPWILARIEAVAFEAATPSMEP